MQASCPFASPMIANTRRQLFYQNSDDFIDVGCVDDVLDNEQTCKKIAFSSKESLHSTLKMNQSFVVDVNNITNRNNKNTEPMRARVQHSPSSKANEMVSNWVQEAKNLLYSPNSSKSKFDSNSFEQEESQKSNSIDDLVSSAIKNLKSQSIHKTKKSYNLSSTNQVLLLYLN